MHSQKQRPCRGPCPSAKPTTRPRTLDTEEPDSFADTTILWYLYHSEAISNKLCSLAQLVAIDWGPEHIPIPSHLLPLFVILLIFVTFFIRQTFHFLTRIDT